MFGKKSGIFREFRGKPGRWRESLLTDAQAGGAEQEFIHMIAIGFVVSELLRREQPADLRFADFAPVQKDVGGDTFAIIL